MFFTIVSMIYWYILYIAYIFIPLFVITAFKMILNVRIVSIIMNNNTIITIGYMYQSHTIPTNRHKLLSKYTTSRKRKKTYTSHPLAIVIIEHRDCNMVASITFFSSLSTLFTNKLFTSHSGWMLFAHLTRYMFGLFGRILFNVATNLIKI